MNEQALANCKSPALVAMLLLLCAASFFGRDGVLALGAVALVASVSLGQIEKVRMTKAAARGE
jgi:hypothetical protein